MRSDAKADAAALLGCSDVYVKHVVNNRSLYVVSFNYRSRNSYLPSTFSIGIQSVPV